MCDSRGDIWVGTHSSGLFYLKQGTNHFVNYKYAQGSNKGPSHNQINRIFEDHNNQILIATQKEELQYINRSSMEFESLSVRMGREVNPGHVYNIYEDASGNLWLATNFGIRYIDFNKDTVMHIVKEGGQENHLASNKASVITGDSKGNIWIGFGGEGLNRYDPETGAFTYYSEQNGLPHNNVSNIFEDDNGNIWLSTGKGLVKFVNGIYKPGEPVFRAYSLSATQEYYGFRESSSYKSSTGEVYIGSHNGLYHFNPTQINENPYPPEIVFTNLEIYNNKVPVTSKGILKKQLNESESIKLSHKESVFTIEFAALNYIFPQKNYYKYKLEGVTDWISNGSSRSVTFSNLTPGEYLLKINAANNHLVWNNRPKQLKITISPPWYKTFVFKLLLFVFLAVLVMVTIRLRERELRQRQLILSRKVEERTREINLQKETLKEQAHRVKTQAENLELANAELVDKNSEVLAQKEHIQEIAERLHEADQLRLKFFTNISHELLTPLTLINGSLEKLIASNSVAGNKNIFTNMLRNSNLLLNLIRQLIDFRKIDKGALKLKAEEVELVGFIKEIKDVFDTVAEKKNIAFELSAGIKSLKTWVDTDKLEKILYNLLSNAFKFTPENGSIKIMIEKGEVLELDNGQKAGSALISIKDTGPGLTKEEMEKVFDRFYKVESKHVPAAMGTGIGLSYVKELTALQKGRITVKSEVGKGATFCLQLPVGSSYLSDDEKVTGLRKVVPDYTSTMVTSHEVEETELPEFKRPDDAPVALIVEDNKSIRTFIKEEFHKHYYIFEAADGLEGFVKAKEHLPDVIVSDIMMPKIDGIELCKN
ncbi:MAG: response regulator [Bacteroidales bacterium]|nr:response regulator [Bacteroidales bacterium]